MTITGRTQGVTICWQTAGETSGAGQGQQAWQLFCCSPQPKPPPAVGSHFQTQPLAGQGAIVVLQSQVVVLVVLVLLVGSRVDVEVVDVDVLELVQLTCGGTSPVVQPVKVHSPSSLPQKAG